VVCFLLELAASFGLEPAVRQLVLAMLVIAGLILAEVLWAAIEAENEEIR
jgi:hypothetical protein